MNKIRLLITFFFLGISACSHVNKDWQVKHENKTKSNLILSDITPDAWQVENDVGFPEVLEWSGLKDPLLLKLIATGIDSNLTVQSAVLRINSAKTSLQQAGTETKPILNIGQGVGFVSKTFPGPVAEYYSFGALVDYKLDLWGIIENKIAISELEFQIEEVTLKATRIEVASLIARTYFSIRVQDEIIQLQKQQIVIQNSQLKLSVIRLKAGTTTPLNVDQLKVSLRQLENALESLRTARARQHRSLATLLGRNSQDFKLPPVKFVFWKIPRTNLDAPVKVVNARPDIKVAELRLKAVGLNLENVRKSWLPTIGFSANVEANAISLSDFLTTNPFSALISSSLSTLLYDNGNRKRLVAQSEISHDLAIVGYEQTILFALEKIENLLSQQNENYRQIALLELEENSQKRVTRITQVRYDTGATSAFNLITEQRNALRVQQAQVRMWLSGMNTSISLLSELGIDPNSNSD